MVGLLRIEQLHSAESSSLVSLVDALPSAPLLQELDVAIHPAVSFIASKSGDWLSQEPDIIELPHLKRLVIYASHRECNYLRKCGARLQVSHINPMRLSMAWLTRA